MIIHEPTKSVVLKLKNPEQVVASVPNSKIVNVRGQQIVLAPYHLDSARILQNLNIKVPSPIKTQYDWPGRFKPFHHQAETASFLTLNKKCFVLNEIGTGKTQAALWAADYLMKLGVVEKALILSPLSTLQRVWGDGIFGSFIHRRFVELYGSADRRHKLLATDADFYIINHDGFGIIADAAVGMFDLVIIDEAAVYRNATTTRFKKLMSWLHKHPDIHLWLMTGTPTPNAPTDAWAQAKLIGSRYLTKNFTSFRELTMMKIGPYKWVPRPESTAIVQHVLQPAIRFDRAECFDLPETIVQTRTVKMTPKQTKYYTKMYKNLVVDLEDEYREQGTIVAVNHAAKVQKLIQIACGVVYDEDSEALDLDATPRVNLVREIIEEAGQKVILFAPLTGVIEMLSKELSKYFTTAIVNGQVSATKRNKIFSDFQHEADPKVLIAHPGTMSHGLTLTSANTIIWYAPITSNEQYTQANGRIERIGKTSVSNVVHIEATELEKEMYSRLQRKSKMQGVLLDLIQGMKTKTRR